MAFLIAYIDSSVLLRVVLRQANPLPEWDAIDRAVVSSLVHLEVSRTLERLWLRQELTESELNLTAATAGEILNRAITLEMDQTGVARYSSRGANAGWVGAGGLFQCYAT